MAADPFRPLVVEYAGCEHAALPTECVSAGKKARLMPTTFTSNAIESRFDSGVTDVTRLRVEKSQGGVTQQVGCS